MAPLLRTTAVHCKHVSLLRNEFCKHFWVHFHIDGLSVWFYVQFVFLCFFSSLIPHVFWDCNLPRRHCCLVGAGKLAEDTSFLCLYIYAWLFSVVALPHCTVHSELDRLSLARQWSRQIITFFFLPLATATPDCPSHRYLLSRGRWTKASAWVCTKARCSVLVHSGQWSL